jgi:hypothetical protein
LINILIKKWQNKSSEQKKLFIEAFYYLIICQILILLYPFKKIIIRQKLEDTNLITQDYPIVESYNKDISWAVKSAAKYVPFKALCLVQALTAQRMLKKRKIKGFLFLGLKKDKGSAKGLAAHAWVKCNNFIITGGDQPLDKYAVISVYSWIL